MKDVIVYIVSIGFLFSNSWEMQISIQDVSNIGASDYIIIGMGDTWHTGFHFGEDEYDLPNATDTYTDLQFFNIDWVGTVDENGNTCCGVGNDGSFYIDKRNFHDPSLLSIWNLSGSTYGFFDDQNVLLEWNLSAFDTLDIEYDIYLYIDEASINMRVDDSVIISEDQLYANYDPETQTVITNMKILVGGCASTGTSLYYFDSDNDGLGAGISMEYCPGSEPENWVDNNFDINDNIACSSNNIDDCDVCDGNNLDQDCNGICFGNAVIDDCGICNGMNINQDCNGVCFGDAAIDDCGICNGMNINQDCDGVCFGDALIDDCGICNGMNTSCLNQIFLYGPQDIIAFIDDEGIYIAWNQENYPEENAIIGFNVYYYNQIENILIGTTANQNFFTSNYSSGEFCINAYDQFGNTSQTNCVESTSMISFCIGLHHSNNLISFPGIPTDVSLSNVFQNLGNDVTGIIAESSAAFHLGNGLWAGALQSIDPYSGYWLILDEVAIEENEMQLCTSGYPSDSLYYQIYEGPNLLSYPFNGSSSIEETIPNEMQNYITGIIGQGVAAANFGNGVWGGALQNLEGTKGYWLISNQNIDEFYYLNPTNEIRAGNNSMQTSLESYNYSISTLQSFYFLMNIEGDIPTKGRNYIISYCNDNITGYREWKNDPIDIPVMGKDNSKHTDLYCQEGDVPSFKLFNSFNNETITLESPKISSWQPNTIKFVELHTIESSNTPNDNEILKVYPNPFNPNVTIEFELEKNEYVSVQILDLYGNIVSDIINDNLSEGKILLNWSPEEVSTGMYFIRLDYNKKNYVKKIIYLK